MTCISLTSCCVLVFLHLETSYSVIFSLTCLDMIEATGPLQSVCTASGSVRLRGGSEPGSGSPVGLRYQDIHPTVLHVEWQGKPQPTDRSNINTPAVSLLLRLSRAVSLIALRIPTCGGARLITFSHESVDRGPAARVALPAIGRSVVNQ